MRHLSVIFIILNITVRIALKNLNCYKIHINLFRTASTNRPIPMHRMRPKTDASKTEASIRPSSRPFRPVGRNASHAFAAMLFRRILPDFARLLQVWRKKPSAGEDGAFEECERKWPGTNPSCLRIAGESAIAARMPADKSIATCTRRRTACAATKRPSEDGAPRRPGRNSTPENREDPAGRGCALYPLSHVSPAKPKTRASRFTAASNTRAYTEQHARIYEKSPSKDKGFCSPPINRTLILTEACRLCNTHLIVALQMTKRNYRFSKLARENAAQGDRRPV